VVDPEINGVSVCGGDRFTWAESIYQTAPQAMTWSAAKTWCSSRGYDLWKPDQDVLWILNIHEEDALGVLGLLPLNTGWHTAVAGDCGGVNPGVPVYVDATDGSCVPVDAGRVSYWGAPVWAVNMVLTATPTATVLAPTVWASTTFSLIGSTTPRRVLCELDGVRQLPEFTGVCAP
jgi:hypothetical protein